MKDEPTNGELAIMLANISEKIEQMHYKQDYTNGKVLLNTEFRNKYEQNIKETIKKEEENTTYRNRQEGVINLVKWIGIANIIGYISILFK